MRSTRDTLKQRVMNGVSFKQRCNYSPKKQKAKFLKSFLKQMFFYPKHWIVQYFYYIYINFIILNTKCSIFRRRNICLYYWSANLFRMYQLWQANQNFHPYGWTHKIERWNWLLMNIKYGQIDLWMSDLLLLP